MLASHTFSPKSSIRSRNATIDSAFVCPSYRGRVAFNYRVLHVAALCAFAAFFYCRFHLISAYLAIYIVDLYLYQQLPNLYRRRGALPARCRLVLQQLPYFLFPLYRLQAQGLLAYRLRRSTPLGSPCPSYTFKCLAYLLLYRVVLYYSCSLYSGCFYIYVQWRYYYFAFQCGAWCPFIGPCNSIQVLVLQFLQWRQGAFYQQFAIQTYTPDLGAVEHSRSYYYCIQQSCASKGGFLG